MVQNHNHPIPLWKPIYIRHEPSILYHRFPNKPNMLIIELPLVDSNKGFLQKSHPCILTFFTYSKNVNGI